jgi:hypothetical protein
MAATLLLVAACEGDKVSGVGCIGPIQLSTVDSVSGAAIHQAIVTLRYPSDTLRTNGDNVVDTLANFVSIRLGDDAGDYDLRVASIGYATWSRHLVGVPAAGGSPCKPPLEVVARLARSP